MRKILEDVGLVLVGAAGLLVSGHLALVLLSMASPGVMVLAGVLLGLVVVVAIWGEL